MTCEMQEWIGAYVLDALEPDETAQFNRHVVGCTHCQDEVVNLAWLPALLGTVQLEDVQRLDERDAEQPSRVLDGLLARAGRRPRVRRVVAAIGLAAALITGAVVLGDTVGGPARPSSVALRTIDPASHVHAAVVLTSRSWGADLHLRLDGVPPRETCSLVVHGRNGQREVAATWTASYRGAANVPATTAIPAEDITSLDVVTATGTRLAHLTLHN